MTVGMKVGQELTIVQSGQGLGVNAVTHPGAFAVTSGRLTVTDPCYTPATWCIHTVPAVNGQWKVELGFMRDETDLHWSRNRLAEAPAERQKLQKELEAVEAHSSEWFLIDYKLRDLERTCKAAQVRIDTYKGRVAYIRAWNVGVHGESCAPITQQALTADFKLIEEADIGVDSGQAGFIDGAFFVENTKNGTDRNTPWREWYDSICDKTCDESPEAPCAAILENCAFSHSGYGDGSYSLFVKWNRLQGEATDVLINFMLDLED